MNTYSQPPYPCVFCEQPTEFGSGRFVNRLPADTHHELPDATTEYRDGYACAECLAIPCCRCDQPIALDEDISVEQVYGEECLRHEFDDGAWRVHLECLTPDEKILFDSNNK